MFVIIFQTLDGNIHCGSQFQNFQTMVTLPHAFGPGQKAHHEDGKSRTKTEKPIFHNSLQGYTHSIGLS